MTPETIRIIPFEQSSVTAGQVADLMHRAFQDHADHNLVFSCYEMTPEDVSREVARGDRFFVATEGEKLVGVITGYPVKGGLYAHVGNLAVDPDYRGREVAKCLLQAIESAFPDVDALLSDTALGAGDSIAWHKKNGFKRIGLVSFRGRNYWSVTFAKPLKKDCKYSKPLRRLHMRIHRTLHTVRHFRKDGSETLLAILKRKELELPDIQIMSMELLKEFATFCDRNSLKWTVAYGTLIGAVRHKGFIPWDDDIDVVMPREDFDRFCSTFKPEKCSFLVPGKDSYLSFARLYDKDSTTSINYCPWHSRALGETGVWIDVFPLDSVPENEQQYTMLYKSLNFLYRKSVVARHFKVLSAIDPTRPGKNLKFWYKRHAHPRSSRDDAEMIVYGACRILDSLKGKHTGWLAQLGCPDCNEPMKVRLKEDWYSQMIPWTFEDMDIRIPAAYDEILRGEYGDYMQLPPRKDRKPQSGHYVRFFWK